ncbi:MAG: hypothetical protein WB988_24320 [Candidatus Nitrosopolaris sp.]
MISIDKRNLVKTLLKKNLYKKTTEHRPSYNRIAEVHEMIWVK